jgi:dTDP-4-dehydrorhamnose reductase
MDNLGSLVLRPHDSALDCSLAAELVGELLDWRTATARPETFAGRF